jgi:hypothetical protein
LNRDLLVFFDEAGCLEDVPLITFLTQIRDGYLCRSGYPNTKFPRSLALIGMRNIRDCLISDHPESVGQLLASPFSIAAGRFTSANFTRTETGILECEVFGSAGLIVEYWSQKALQLIIQPEIYPVI